MNRMHNNNDSFENAIGDFLGIVNCLLIVADIGNYKKWLSEHYSIRITRSHLRGYKLLFETLFRMLVSDIERNSSLDLTSDLMFNRASFTGTSVNVLPNTCEKTILIKNLQKYFNQVMNSNSWGNLEEGMIILSREVLYPFNGVREASSSISKTIDLDTAIVYSSIFQTYIFLNDTRKGIPHGYMPAMIVDEEIAFGYQYKAAKRFGNAFEGYKYGVQYLWAHLLKDRFQKSVVNEINETSDWESFDNYFNKIQMEIIDPIEKSTKAFMGYDHYIKVKKSPKQYFQELVIKTPSEKELSPKELLKRYFLWYPIRLIDCRDFDFSGIPVLIPLLRGMAQNNEKIQIIRLVHGKAEDHRRDYSYAVLIGLSGIISDASGWMLFWDCCSDQGSTSGLFKDIENSIKKYQKEEFVELQNIRIEKKEFIELMKREIISEHVPYDEDE